MCSMRFTVLIHCAYSLGESSSGYTGIYPVPAGAGPPSAPDSAVARRPSIITVPAGPVRKSP